MTTYHYIRGHRSGAEYAAEIACMDRAEFLATLEAWNRVGQGVWTYRESL